jgi:hypothetical protein
MDSNELQHTMHTVTSLKKEYKTIAAAKTAFNLNLTLANHQPMDNKIATSRFQRPLEIANFRYRPNSRWQY